MALAGLITGYIAIAGFFLWLLVMLIVPLFANRVHTRIEGTAEELRDSTYYDDAEKSESVDFLQYAEE